jgi:hypothetical protein
VKSTAKRTFRKIDFCKNESCKKKRGKSFKNPEKSETIINMSRKLMRVPL